MEELELNYDVIQSCIDELRTISVKFPSLASPMLYGDGECIEEIKVLVKLYESFYRTLQTLSEETAGYLEQAAAAFREADEKGIQ